MVSRTQLFLVTVLFVLLPLSGCFGSGDEGAEASDTDEKAFVVGNGTFPAVSVGEEFVFEPGEFDYEDGLVRFAIVADEDVEVEATYTSRLPPFAEREDCLAVSATSPHGVFRSNETGVTVERPQGFSVVHYRTGEWTNAVRARAADEQVSTPSNPVFRFTGDAKIHEEKASWMLPAGRQILIEFGGTSPVFPNDVDDDEVPNESKLTVRVSANATMTRLPDAGIRCGTAFYDASGGAFVEGPFTAGTATVLSSVELETTDASTLAWRMEFHVRTEATVWFLDERIQVDLLMAPLPGVEYSKEIHRNASEPGRLGIEIQESVDFAHGSAAWVLADADWPYLQMLSPLPPDE